MTAYLRCGNASENTPGLGRTLLLVRCLTCCTQRAPENDDHSMKAANNRFFESPLFVCKEEEQSGTRSPAQKVKSCGCDVEDAEKCVDTNDTVAH